MRAPVQPRRSAGLEAASAQAELLQRLAQQNRVGLARPSRRILLLAAVDQPVEERSGGDDDGLRADGAAVAQAECRERADGRQQSSVMDIGGSAFG